MSDDLDDDWDDPEPPDDPFPVSPRTDESDTPPPERPVRDAYPGRAGCVGALGIPIAFVVMLFGTLLQGDVDTCALGPHLICHGVVYWLPVEALCLTIVLFAIGGIVATERPSVRESGGHWGFFVVGIVVFILACGIFLGLAAAATPAIE